MFDYGDITDVADEVLTEFGAECAVTVTGEQEFDPETREITATVRETQGKCVFGGLSYQYIQAHPNLVQDGDVKLTLTASCKPQNNALVRCNGELWRIVQCRPIKPAGVDCAFTAHARREYE